MPEKYILDKALKTGTLYRSEPDIYYVIEQVGTDSTTKGTLEIDGSTVLEILDNLAQPNPTDAKRFPPIDLKTNYLVIPPDKTFKFTGSSGSVMRILGSLFSLAPGEAITPAYASRFTEQPRKYYTYESATWTPTADGTLSADEEKGVLDVTCSGGERWRFDRYLYLKRSNELANKKFGNVGIRIFIDDKPLDNIDPAKGPMAIDSNVAHYYDGTNHFYMPLSLERTPIALETGRNLKIKVRNISGADITYTAAEQIRIEAIKQRELIT